MSMGDDTPAKGDVTRMANCLLSQGGGTQIEKVLFQLQAHLLQAHQHSRRISSVISSTRCTFCCLFFPPFSMLHFSFTNWKILHDPLKSRKPLPSRFHFVCARAIQNTIRAFFLSSQTSRLLFEFRTIRVKFGLLFFWFGHGVL